MKENEQSKIIDAASAILKDHDGLTSDGKHVLVKVKDFEQLEKIVNEIETGENAEK